MSRGWVNAPTHRLHPPLLPILRLEAEYLRPLGAQLGRIPLGRKGYNCRVERSHRTDDEEFYLPCVLLLDNIVLEWSRHGVPAVNDVLTHYIGVPVQYLLKNC